MENKEYNINHWIITYEQHTSVSIISEGNEWVLLWEEDEIARTPKVKGEDEEDAAFTFKKMGCFEEIEEWCEEQEEEAIREYEEYKAEVISTYYRLCGE